MKIIQTPSPNFDARGRAIDMIIFHYTGMESGAAALARLRDPEAKVSAHYLVEENGDVYQLVADDNRAWHAGVASWKGESDINARSVGVEIVNPGHEFGYRDFPEAQIESVLSLVRGLVDRHGVKPTYILGHSDVAPRRKEDPGEKFPWRRLADEGLALAPYDGDGESGGVVSYEDALRALSKIGYDAPPGDHAAALLAFQRRFCPASLGQGFDKRTKAALVSVSTMF
ncbi:MAG: N-acetylmuramoyl-L-alanine amidase [Pseudomonadota bacterium]